MSHEITIREDGFAEMAYLEGVTRWHGLGNELPAGATLEQWQDAAGMNWKACRARVRYSTSRDASPDSYLEYDGKVVIFRSDNKSAMGVVSDKFQLVQPRETLEFWRDLTGEGGMQLQTAGTLFGGSKFWALAKVGESFVIDPKQIVRDNLLLATAIDGTMATEGFYCSTVVVCNNTLRGAQGEGTPKVRITHRSKFDAKQVKADLGIEAAQSAFEKTIATMRELAQKRMKESDVIVATSRLFKPSYDQMSPKEKDETHRSKPVATIGKLALDHTAIGSEYDGMRGTAWGWLNSVTEYVDHSARAKNADRRFDSAYFGKGADLKAAAFEYAKAYAPSMSDLISSINKMAPKPAKNDSGDTALLDRDDDDSVY